MEYGDVARLWPGHSDAALAGRPTLASSNRPSTGSPSTCCGSSPRLDHWAPSRTQTTFVLDRLAKPCYSARPIMVISATKQEMVSGARGDRAVSAGMEQTSSMSCRHRNQLLKQKASQLSRDQRSRGQSGAGVPYLLPAGARAAHRSLPLTRTASHTGCICPGRAPRVLHPAPVSYQHNEAPIIPWQPSLSGLPSRQCSTSGRILRPSYAQESADRFQNVAWSTDARDFGVDRGNWLLHLRYGAGGPHPVRQCRVNGKQLTAKY